MPPQNAACGSEGTMDAKVLLTDYSRVIRSTPGNAPLRIPGSDDLSQASTIFGRVSFQSLWTTRTNKDRTIEGFKDGMSPFAHPLSITFETHKFSPMVTLETRGNAESSIWHLRRWRNQELKATVLRSTFYSCLPTEAAHLLKQGS